MPRKNSDLYVVPGEKHDPEPIIFPKTDSTPELLITPPHPDPETRPLDMLRTAFDRDIKELIRQQLTKALYGIAKSDIEVSIEEMSFGQFEAFMAQIWSDE